MDQKFTEQAVQEGQGKKGKVLRFFTGLLLAVLLLAGLFWGLRVSGGLVALADSARPYLLRVPLVGEPVLALLDSGRAPMTADERRALELEETREELLAWEVRLRAERNRLKKEKAAVEKLRKSLDERERNLENRGESEEGTQETFARLVAGFEEMSSRKAAGIIARLPRERALAVLKALSQEKMSEVLAKMDPGVAARMAEALSKKGAQGGTS